jgi:hypothetical protein
MALGDNGGEAMHIINDTRIGFRNSIKNKRGRDRNPASYKIQYPMKNRNKDVFNNRNAAFLFKKSF